MFADHIPALDGLRGIAILLVLFCHFTGYALTSRPPRIIEVLGSFGRTGVDLFFVLSGFLITRILLRSRERDDLLRNFYARRVLRIFPLYYGFVFFLYVIIPALHIGEAPNVLTQLSTWTYMQNVAMTFFPSPSRNVWQWTPHFWSLAVEEHFYLVWPFIVKYANPRRLPWIIAGAVPFAILSRILVLWSGHGSDYLTPCRVDGLGLGALLAIATLNPHLYESARRLAPKALVAIVPVCAVAMFLFSGSRMPVIQVFKNTAAAIAYSALLLLILNSTTRRWVRTLLAKGVLPMVGRYSYGMYVFHLTIIGLLNTYLHRWSPLFGFAVVLATTLAVAALSWHVYEQPFLRMKRYFPTAGRKTSDDRQSLAVAAS